MLFDWGMLFTVDRRGTYTLTTIHCTWSARSRHVALEGLIVYILLCYNLVAMSHAKSSASAPTVCPISFNPEQYSVAENVQGGTVEVCLTVEENCYGDFSVMLQTGNKSAQGH